MNTTEKAFERAHSIYKNQPSSVQEAYVRGYIDAVEDMSRGDPQFFEEVAKGLRKLWPSGEKDGKYPWRDSVSNLVKRLEFIWKERRLKDSGYTVEDCLQAARKYLAQFEDDVKYMQVLKYFIFKQDKLVSSTGKVTYTYKSSLCDLLESNITATGEEDWIEAFDATQDIEII